MPEEWTHRRSAGARGASTTLIEGRALRGGLSPWQERRAKEAMNANLHGDVSIAELARECGLSNSHFARAFKQATGRPPYQWLLEGRVETAQRPAFELADVPPGDRHRMWLC